MGLKGDDLLFSFFARGLFQNFLARLSALFEPEGRPFGASGLSLGNFPFCRLRRSKREFSESEKSFTVRSLPKGSKQ